MGCDKAWRSLTSRQLSQDLQASSAPRGNSNNAKPHRNPSARAAAASSNQLSERHGGQPQHSQRQTNGERRERKCKVCGGDCKVFIKCKVFNSKSVDERRAFVTSQNHCINCLRYNHNVKDCTSEKRCNECGEKHHGWLHNSPNHYTTPANGQPRHQSAHSAAGHASASGVSVFHGVV